MSASTQLSISEIKREAKDQLSGRWREAILLHLIPVAIAVLFAGGIYGLDLMSLTRLYNTGEQVDLVVSFLVTFISIGISFTLLDMVRSREFVIQPLQHSVQIFSKKYFIPIFIIQMLQVVFVTLWSFLFIIPGIIKSYSYSQAFFIYKDRRNSQPEEFPTSLECITESREMMNGHKLELFVLHLSFIGWHLLEAFTLGIAALYVRPYLNTAEAVFYNKLAKEEHARYSQYKEHEADTADEADFADF
ncbi:DUF975 family protein [Alkalibacterium sp.]|nr:MAG: DUF975 family protein [Alkalibacterium sp.]